MNMSESGKIMGIISYQEDITMSRRKPTINALQMRRYLNYLKEQERSAATLSKYAHDLAAFCNYLQGEALNKMALIDWKQENERLALVLQTI